MFRTKQITTPLTLKAPGDGAEGSVSAVFSTFGVPDRDGDIVLASAFTPGQAVPMVWCHDWDDPIGRGQIDVTTDAAVFNGRFFTETQRGTEAYKTVKAMADLQEWSWGFRVLAGDPGVYEGQNVFYIREAEVFEVSPVLVGAGINTHTTAIKGHDLDYERHAAYVQQSIRELIERTQAGLAKRANDAKAMSATRRDQVDSVIASLEAATAELRGLITDPEQSLDPVGIYAEFQRIQSTLNGVEFRSN